MVNQAEETQVAGRRTLRDATLRPRRVLLFEDDEVCCYGLATILHKAGYEVTVTRHFVPALQALEGLHPPDILVADIVMPPGEVNGLAMARMARMKHRAIKIIYITGYDLPRVGEEALGPVLWKPVSGEEFLSTVNELLGDG